MSPTKKASKKQRKKNKTNSTTSIWKINWFGLEGNTYLKMPSSKETKQQNIIEFMNLYEKAKKYPTKENFEALEKTSSFRSIEYQYNKIEEEG